MIFIFVSVFVPLVIFFLLPPSIKLLTGKQTENRSLLCVACVLYFVSWHLPSPYIDGQNTAFTTHFVGGGIFSALLWLYIKKYIKTSYSIFYDLAAIYFLVSGLGVANELFEFTITQLGLVNMTSFDTWWDLLANTTGAFSVWLAYAGYRYFKTRSATN